MKKYKKEMCKICGKDISINMLHRHLKLKHNIILIDYYNNFYKKEHEGECLNCGNLTFFESFTKGYRKFCSSKCSNTFDETNELRSKSLKKVFSDPILGKISREKYVNTCLERYGVDNASKSESVKEKIKNTNMERYGCVSTAQVKEVIDKAKNTCLKRYGVDNAFKCDFAKEKYRETCLERYGVDNYSKTEDFKIFQHNYLRKNREEYLKSFCDNENLTLIESDNGYVKFFCNTCGKDFVLKNYDLLNRIKRKEKWCIYCNPEYDWWSTSRPEKDLLNFVSKNYFYEIIVNSNKIIKPYELDIYLPNNDLAFEFNGLYWHSSKFIDIKYHLKKTNLCEQNNIHLIHIYEDDWTHKQNIVESNILKLLHSSPILYPNNYIVQEISLSNSKDFLESNSLQFDKEYTKSFGLFSNNTLVYVLTLNKNKINNISETIKYTVKDAFQIVFNYLKENLQYDSYKLILDRSWYKTENTFGEFRFNKYIKEKSFFIINNKREDSIKDEKDNERILKIYNSGYLEYIWSREENKDA